MIKCKNKFKESSESQSVPINIKLFLNWFSILKTTILFGIFTIQYISSVVLLSFVSAQTTIERVGVSLGF